MYVCIYIITIGITMSRYYWFLCIKFDERHPSGPAAQRADSFSVA